MKKILLSTLAGIVLTAGVVAVFPAQTKAFLSATIILLPSTPSTGTGASNAVATSTSAASSAPNAGSNGYLSSNKFLTVGTGTTTLNLQSDGFDRFGINFSVTATATNAALMPVVGIALQCTSDGIDYFPVDRPTLFQSGTSTVISPFEDVYTWTLPGTTTPYLYGVNASGSWGFSTTTFYRHVEFPQLSCKNARAVIFSKSGNFALWAQPTGRRDAQ